MNLSDDETGKSYERRCALLASCSITPSSRFRPEPLPARRFRLVQLAHTARTAWPSGYQDECRHFSTNSDRGRIAVLAYTTNQPWTSCIASSGREQHLTAKPPRAGQDPALFTLDYSVSQASRSRNWCPAGWTRRYHGVRSRLPVWHRSVYETATKTLTTRHPENIERLTHISSRGQGADRDSAS